MITVGGYLIEFDGVSPDCELQLTTGSEVPGVDTMHVRMTWPTARRPEPVRMHWRHRALGVHAQWYPTVRYARALDPVWNCTHTAKATYGAPIHCLHGFSGENRLTFAFSDALNPLVIAVGLEEESATIACSLTLFTEPMTPIDSYDATLRLDTRALPYSDSINDVAQWWATLPGCTPSAVPEHARRPAFSTWYNFHQNVDAGSVEAQCRLAKDFGMDVVIVDDGWQTADARRGYAYCGDWLPERSKFPDMAAHVARVHEIGMKYVLWYSVPFVGPETAAFARFEGKFLEHLPELRTYVVDPRFPEVRDYLITNYENAMAEWDIDGFKLDFVDAFNLTEDKRDELGGGRDYDSVPEAVDRLMTDTMDRLRARKPDVLIEFRQNYVGPLMRKYGNMFRAADVPNDTLGNRLNTLDVRLMAGNTAVHADMLMWNGDDSADDVALQLIATLFAVPQISVLLDSLSDEHAEVLRFWLALWRENSDVLLDGKVSPVRPDSLYSHVVAELGSRQVWVCHSDSVVTLAPEHHDRVLIVNGTPHVRLVIDSVTPAVWAAKVFDSRGRVVRERATSLDAGLQAFEIPVAGVAVLDRRD